MAPDPAQVSQPSGAAPNLPPQPPPLAPDSPTAFGRHLTPVAAETRPPEQQACQPSATAVVPRPASPVLPVRDLIETLPTELLHLIFRYLPLSTQKTCALVCRYWYVNLPPAHTQVSDWWQQRSPAQRWRSQHLAAGYSSRTRALLQAVRHPLLPMLDTRHQEVLSSKIFSLMTGRRKAA